MQQKLALQILKSGKNAFLTGSPGTGKTYVLNEFIKWLRKNKVKVAITASTGIAATHLSGQTIHSWSKINVKDYLTEWDLDELSQNQTLVKRINSTEVLIIDEISMIHASFLDSLNNLLKFIRGENKPFGGIQVVLSGDFFQLPPVNKNNAPNQFAFQSLAWQEANFQILYLEKQYRQKDALLNILESIRNKTITQKEKELILQRLNISAPNKDIIKLETHNKHVDEFNERKLLSIKSNKVYEYPAVLKGNKAIAENILRNILAPEILKLKKGARVIFVKNDPHGEYVNGSLGVVVDFENNIPIVKLDSGYTVEAKPVDWEFVNESGKVLATVTQIPLKLAWAITIHKSQGMSLDAARVNLQNSFVPGQGYVALSRLRSLDGLYLEGINEISFDVNSVVFAFDKLLKKESDNLERNIKLTHDTIHITKKEKIDTYLKTKKAILHLSQNNNEFSLKDIAQLRQLKPSTIITHINKLINDGEKLPIHYIKELDGVDIKEVFNAFKEEGTKKLTVIYEKLNGKYNYEQLHLARAILQQEKLI